MGTESIITTISRLNYCYYSAYALLPTSGVLTGSLGFATDRLVLYRWSGTVWENITIFIASGVLANIPVAATLPEGSLYYATDAFVLYQIQAGIWQPITGATVSTLAVSDDLRNSNNTERSNLATSYTKIKEILLNANLAACRIKFDMYATAGKTGRAKIYKNGVAIGAEQSNGTGAYVTYSEDFTGFVSGDLIQIYGYVFFGDSATEYVYIRNMRFYYKKVITALSGDTLSAPLDVATDPTISVTNQDP